LQQHFGKRVVGGGTRDWAPEIVKNNTWHDADMLAIGRLRVSDTGGKGEPGKFTADEQRTMMPLWSIMRSPLILCGVCLRQIQPLERLAMATSGGPAAGICTSSHRRQKLTLPPYRL
jgi:hypothetical protein